MSFFLWIWLGRKTDGVGPAVRPPVRAVLRAHFWSKVTGSYWEDEMLRQSKSVTSLALPDRLAFYRTILLSCDLKNYRALLFFEAVGDDAESLRQDLVTFKTAANFPTLSTAQRKNVDGWIDELRVVAEQRSAEVSRTNAVMNSARRSVQ